MSPNVHVQQGKAIFAVTSNKQGATSCLHCLLHLQTCRILCTAHNTYSTCCRFIPSSDLGLAIDHRHVSVTHV